MPVVGTAGHVDHGKTTLIQALTGRDPDRLAEEKRRGLTIDLGFAWTSIAGTDIGFVDVPGHERFIKNMLAGIDAVQAVLFVVAADEGWMPQSEEHLAIIDLLDHRHGIVALTRRDLVDEDTAELAKLEVTERLEGTSLEGAQIIEVAAPTGTGLDELRSALASLVAEPTPETGRTRMWIDRSFTIAGSGTVVTGTLAGGRISVGDDLELWPGPVAGRVRSLQSHERTIDEAQAGTRVAVNLGGVDAAQVKRGAMIGLPGQWMATKRLLVTTRSARDREITDRGAFHLHAGSGAWPVRIRLLDDGAAFIMLPDAVPLAMGDRFILREVGRRAVVGGGRVLDPAPERRRPSERAIESLTASLESDPAHRADVLVDVRGRADVEAVAAHAGAEPVNRLRAGKRVFSEAVVADIVDSATTILEEFHRASPLRPGMPSAELAGQLGLTVDELVTLTAGKVVFVGSVAKNSDFSGGLGDREEAALAEVRNTLLEAGLAAPRASRLGLDLELRHALERRGDLVRIDDDLVYLPEHLEEMRTILDGLGDQFTVAEFRDACGLSRRQAVPLLEWFDRQGVTERSGDTRKVRR